MLDTTNKSAARDGKPSAQPPRPATIMATATVTTTTTTTTTTEMDSTPTSESPELGAIAEGEVT